jgi:hypothetical protein
VGFDIEMRTDAELRELSPHLYYEIRMLLMTDLLLVREGGAPRDPNRLDDWTIHNALLESHTVHARALYAFFFQEPRQPDDAVAGDYVLDWNLKRPTPDPVLNTVSPRVGKEIAHFTYGRLVYKTDKERQWTFTKITKALIDVINIWLADAPVYVRVELQSYLQEYADQPEVRLRQVESR